MKIGFIGAGRVGCSLGKYFSENNISLSGYYSRTYENAKFASDYTESLCFGDFSSLANSSDIIFITVKDSAISEVWDKLSLENIKGKIICQCSGAMSSEVFYNALEKGAFSCSVHPMLAISGKDVDVENFAKAFFTVEGNLYACEKIKEILTSIGNKVKIIENPNKKILYHLACVFQSNLINALVSMGIDFLQECGFEQKEALSAIKPLIFGNLENVFEKGVENALTGPVERCDINTVKKHIDILSDDNELIYKLLSLKIADVAALKNKNVSYDDLKKILEVYQ